MTASFQDSVAARIAEMAARLRDLTPITSVVAADLMTFVDDRFASSTAPDGSAWADLSESTLMARGRDAAGPSRTTRSLIGPLREGVSRTVTRRWTRRRSEAAASAIFNAKPLIDTGRLRGSIFARGKTTGLQFGTNVPYGPPHQVGASNGRPPQRAFLPADSTGSAFTLSATGPGGDFWRDARSRISRFIRTGEVT